MTMFSRISLLLALVAACGFPRPDDVPGQGDDAPGDGALQPGLTIHVSTTGNDANDGLAHPVKTLKHAIGLAAEDSQIKNIALASGRYSTENGETFPYGVPANLAIVGPAGGGAILVGTKAEPGLMIDAAKLQDLEFEDFAVAVVATGTSSLTGIRIRTSAVALRAETTAKLTIDNLDITSTTAACAAGIVLNGAADLSATTLLTRNLGTTLETKDQSTTNLTKADIAGDVGCTQSVVIIKTSRTFVLRDGLLDGGGSGISLFPESAGLKASLTNTVLRNFKADAIDGGPNGGGTVEFAMTGGEISGNVGSAGQLGRGNWAFQDVVIKQNKGGAMYLQDGSLVMRGCSVTGNTGGITLQSPAGSDLGTIVSPGNNTLQGNVDSGLDCNACQIQIEAVGNIWIPGVQGADSAGKYSNPAVLQGPIAYVPGGNYSMVCNSGECALHR